MLLQEDREYFISLKGMVKENSNLDSIVIPKTTVVEAQDVTRLLEDLAGAQQELENSNNNIESDHPIYQNLQSKYNRQKQSLITKVNLYVNYIDKKLSEINNQIAEMESKVPTYPAKERQYREIQRRIEQNEKVLATLSQKKIEFEIAKASQTPNFEVLQEARPEDAYPAKSNSRIYYMMASLLGLSLPVSLLLIKKSNSSKILEKEEIKSKTSLSILHAIGHNPFNKILPVYYYPQASITDSFRYIRTNLMFKLKNYDPKIIMVSSMVTGEGKSFFTSNLGAVMAMGGLKTVIVSADIRKPTLHKAFSMENKLGLSDFLTNNSNHENIIQSTFIEKLNIIPPGKNIPNPGDMLIPEKIDTLLDYLSSRFEYILFDSPPFSMVPEAVILGERANCNIFLLRQNYSPKPTLESLNDIKNEGRLKNMFLIINGIKRMKGLGFEYYFGYDSNYNFGYFDSYYNNKNVPTGLHK
jgi:capsular exopolysaccharide synthesis family protein